MIDRSIADDTISTGHEIIRCKIIKNISLNIS